MAQEQAYGIHSVVHACSHEDQDNIFNDYHTGDSICRNCGLVLERLLDAGMEATEGQNEHDTHNYNNNNNDNNDEDGEGSSKTTMASDLAASRFAPTFIKAVGRDAKEAARLDHLLKDWLATLTKESPTSLSPLHTTTISAFSQAALAAMRRGNAIRLKIEAKKVRATKAMRRAARRRRTRGYMNRLLAVSLYRSLIDLDCHRTIEEVAYASSIPVKDLSIALREHFPGVVKPAVET